MEDIVARELASGKTPRQIAKSHNLDRSYVQKIANSLNQQKNSNRNEYFRNLFSVAVVFAVLWGVIFFLASARARVSDKDLRDKLNSIAINIDRSATPSKWYFAQNTFNGGDVSKKIEFTSIQTVKINQAMQNNIDVPEVAELQKKFGGKIIPSLFIAMGDDGISQQITRGPEEMKLASSPDRLEVSFYGERDYNNPKIHQNTLFYNISWGALILGAFQFTSDAWFDATICHELWHAKLHREGAKSSTAKTLSDDWIDEEVESHTIERKVLNRHTGGEYFKLLTLYSKSHKASTIQDFAFKVEENDLLKLGEIFEKSSKVEAGTRFTQYYFDLTMTWLDQNYSGETLVAKKREAYRILSSAFGGV